MVKRYFIIFFLFLSCIMVGPVSAGIVGETNEQVQSKAEAVLENILEGFAEDDYQKYARDFDEFLKEAIPEDKFLLTTRQIKDAMGICVAREYLGFLNKGEMTVGLWKGTFDGTSEDMLIKLVLSERGDKIVVTGLWFQ